MRSHLKLKVILIYSQTIYGRPYSSITLELFISMAHFVWKGSFTEKISSWYSFKKQNPKQGTNDLALQTKKLNHHLKRSIINFYDTCHSKRFKVRVCEATLWDSDLGTWVLTLMSGSDIRIWSRIKWEIETEAPVIDGPTEKGRLENM